MIWMGEQAGEERGKMKQLSPASSLLNSTSSAKWKNARDERTKETATTLVLYIIDFHPIFLIRRERPLFLFY
jgi:hypothetical protein